MESVQQGGSGVVDANPTEKILMQAPALSGYTVTERAVSVCPLVRSPDTLVDLALKMARVSSQDLLVDLGCGEGQVLTRAAATCGARCVGFEIDPTNIARSRAAARKANVSDKVQVVEFDLMKAAEHPVFGAASVVYAYLIPNVIKHLEPMLRAAVENGKRVLLYCTTGFWAAPGNLIGDLPPMGEDMMGMLRLYCTASTYRRYQLDTLAAPIANSDAGLMAYRTSIGRHLSDGVSRTAQESNQAGKPSSSYLCTLD